MKRPSALFGILVLTLSLGSAPRALASAERPAPPRPSGLTDAQWREDLDFLVKAIIEKHRDPFDRCSRPEFEKAAAALREAIPGLSDPAVVFGLGRLVAMLRDGHSRLAFPIDPVPEWQSSMPVPSSKPAVVFHLLPVSFYLFSDGLYIIAATPSHADLIGSKVAGIGRLGSEAALEAVRPLISYDSEEWTKEIGPHLLQVPEILQACGAVESAARIPLTLERAGTTSKVELGPLLPGAPAAWNTYARINGRAEPLYLRHKDKAFWLQEIPEARCLFIQINEIQDDRTETLAAFAARAAETARRAKCEKLVLDLRLNGGGNNYLGRGLILALLGLEGLNRYGHLFTIIGRSTFSAAINTVSALERWTDTIFVGEPTGNSPSQYGDARKYPLPHGGLVVRLSSVYWRDGSADERRPWIAPDIPAVPSWADYAAGRDPALEAALAYRPPETLLGRLEEKFRWGGTSAMADHYYKYRTDPRTAGISTEGALLDLADFLISNKNPTEAVWALRLCVQDQPGSFRGWLALGKLLVGQGDGKEAVQALKQSLTLKPGDAEASDWLRKSESLVR